MDDTYLTISRTSEGIYKEKMSKFLSFAIPVTTVDEVKRELEKYQKEYYDARHVCWAYMLGHERTQFRSNDNGEPSGTAGKPILGQINSANLTDILIVVVRYFGGIKLGTSGLIIAYREAAAEAIAANEIVERLVEDEVQFGFEPAHTPLPHGEPQKPAVENRRSSLSKRTLADDDRTRENGERTAVRRLGPRTVAKTVCHPR